MGRITRRTRSSRSVSGLVTNLMTTDGDATRFQYGEVASIVQATASNLDNNAHWSVSVARTAPNAVRVTARPKNGIASVARPTP